MQALVDNDILVKGACYGLFEELFGLSSQHTGELGVLGAAKFVVAKAIQSSRLQGNPERGIERLKIFLDRCTCVEPTDEEQNLAAEFELQAQQAGVALDSGESQLCAVLIVRALPLLHTGDKRAIQALEELLTYHQKLQSLCGKVLCLEQLVLSCTSEENLKFIRAAICSEPDVDKALSISFSCKSKDTTFEIVAEGLNSYINYLRQQAPQILAS